MEDKDIRKELDQLSPFLEKLKKQQQQDVPDGYFDKLNKEILVQTIENKPVKVNKFNLLAFAKIAAAIILLIGIGFAIKPFIQTDISDFDPISQEEMRAYIEDYIDDISELELTSFIDDSDLATTPTEQDYFDEIDIDDFSEELFEEQL